MSTTNHTTNYELSQYIGTDVTGYLSNYNSDMYKIDAQMKVNATAAASAQSDASAAVSAATSAASSASAAVSTANAANTAAEAAQTAATAAQTAAGAAQTDAAAALRASASNTIGNLAPAYDPTLTYAVGDLVTYVDPETNQGKLYKNIIPIATPEEFNINKWDDVTTSEVYARITQIVAEHTTQSGETYKDVYDALYTEAGGFDINSEYLLVEHQTVYGFKSIKHSRQVSPTECVFIDSRLDDSHFFEYMVTIKSGNTSVYRESELGTTPSFSVTNASANTYPFATAALYKLSTL